jgi:hypothetical protein
LADDAPERDVDARRLFGIDFKTNATRDLAVSAFLLGDGEYARRLMDRSVRKAWSWVTTRRSLALDEVKISSSATPPILRPRRKLCAQRCHWQKLYQSTGRPAEAHAILPPAVKGFSPTTQVAAALALI